MPKIAKADLDEIFADTEVAETVTIAGNSVNGHFFAAYESALGIQGTNPVFKCEAGAATTAGAARGVTLVYNATNYTIETIQPETAGTVTIELSEA